MSENVSTNVSVGGAKIDGDNLDMDALRDLSVTEYDKEFGAPNPQQEKPKKSVKAEAVIDDDKEEEKQEAAESAEEAGDEKADGDEEEKEDEGDGDEDGEEGEEEEGEAKEEKEEDRPGKYAVAKSKDGKTYKVPKDAIIEVKVDGKIESLPLQEIMNRASGASNLDKKYREYAEKEKAHVEKVRAFEKQAEEANDNLKMIMNIAQNGTPEDLAQYYGLLTGQEPSKILQDLLERTISYADQFSQMTDRERDLYNENRKFKFQQELVKMKQGREAQTQALTQEKAEVEQALKDRGLTMEDFFQTAHEIRGRLEKGELQGKFSALDIVEMAAASRLDKNVKSAIRTVNKSLLFNSDFVKRISKAVAAAEAASGEGFSVEEVQNLVRSVMEEKKKGLSESLSRKVERHDRSGKTNSQNANSRNQRKSDEGVTLRDHYDRIWGDR